MNSFTQHAIQSCIVAGAVGDALGGIAERHAKTLSDDTQLTLATCEAILAVGHPEPHAIAQHMRAWFVAGEITGLGSSTLKALRDLEAGAHWALAGARGERAAGNGAAMRARGTRTAARYRPDHSPPRRGIHRCVGGRRCSAASRHGAGLVQCGGRPAIARQPRPRQSRAGRILAGLEAVVREVGSSGFVAETVPVAFEVARRMHVVGIEAALYELNSLGGDTDTIGSLAGQLWGVVSGHNAAHLLSDVPGADKVTSIADRFAEYAVGA